MDRQEFNARFSLLECLEDGDVRSFAATAHGTDPVTVHLLPPPEHPKHDLIRTDLDRLIEQGLDGLEVFDLAGRSVAVTGAFEKGQTLEGWLLDRIADLSEPAPDSFDVLMGGSARADSPEPVTAEPADADAAAATVGEGDESTASDEARSEDVTGPAADPAIDRPLGRGAVLGDDESGPRLDGITEFLVAPSAHEETRADEKIGGADEPGAPEATDDPGRKDQPEAGAVPDASPQDAPQTSSDPESAGSTETRGQGAPGGLTQYFDISQLESEGMAPPAAPHGEPEAVADSGPEPEEPRDALTGGGREPSRAARRESSDPHSGRATSDGDGASGPIEAREAGPHSDGFTTLLMGVSKPDRSPPSDSGGAPGSAQPDDSGGAPEDNRGRGSVSGLTHQFDRSAPYSSSSAHDSIPETRTSQPASDVGDEDGSEFGGLAGWRLGGSPSRPARAGESDVGLGLDNYMDRLGATPAPSHPSEPERRPGPGKPVPLESAWSSGDEPTVLSPAGHAGSSGGASAQQVAPGAADTLSRKTIVVFVAVVAAVILITVALLVFFSARAAG